MQSDRPLLDLVPSVQQPVSRRVDAQPIAMTGVLRHCFLWVTSSTQDLVFENPAFNKDPGDQGIAIYCVHGTADRVNSFSLIAERLIAAGLPDNVSSIHLVSFDQRLSGKSVETFSLQLKDKIVANGHKRVVLMGHSRGGLVIAHFAEYLAEENGIEVPAIFPISAPFWGSDLAIAPLCWISDSVKQMRTDSEFLPLLRAKMEAHLARYHFFAGDEDLLVNLHSAFIPAGRGQLIILDGHGHLSIMSSHRLVECVRQLLMGNRYVYSLNSACGEIQDYIAQLKTKKHIWSSEAKVSLLEKLYGFLSAMLEGERGAQYPDTHTVGDFISAFLSDDTMHNGVKPVDAINSSLNFPLSFWNASSYKFVFGLVARYKNTPLTIAQVQSKILLKEEVSKTQNQQQSALVLK